uniref:NADH-ubiquinone oxidoreductase chain 4L n=1 Tax=Bugula neritina TaxID=10212 RepID=A9UKA3_BUGNE|nr:NADH dehydrogenase subunit 4L [Bugula neritina]AAT79561.1 NADH dehydrogenase subunit 4L [Bugula neritina]
MFSKTFTSMNMVFFLMMMMTVMSMFFMRKQLLLLLITLELMNLMVFMMLLLKMVSQIQPISIAFYMLIMSACEASMALSLMISLTRIKGSDMLSLISKFQF